MEAPEETRQRSAWRAFRERQPGRTDVAISGAGLIGLTAFYDAADREGAEATALALGLAGALLILAGCSAEDYAREEALPLPRSADEVRAERLLNEFSDNLDSGDLAAVCQQMTRVLQLRYAIQSGRRNGGCESAMQTVADAGGLGRIEVQGRSKPSAAYGQMRDKRNS